MSETIIEKAFKSAVKSMAKSQASYSSEKPQIKGMLIDRDPPISTGWCGNDDCKHINHNDRRSAQKAADTRNQVKTV